MRIKTMVMALAMMLAGCATVGQQSIRPNIYVMRHLHTPAGVTNPDLTAEGQRFALLVDQWFQRDPPGVIYVSSTKRAQQTAEPLARRLQLAPKIYDPADTTGLVSSVSKETGTVFIVGHSNTVPDIVERLGGQRPAPLVHEDFGDIWRIFGTPPQTSHAKLGE